MTLLKLISTFCVLGSVGLLVVWTIRMSLATVEKIQSVFHASSYNPPLEIKELALISTAAKHGVYFLGWVRKLQAKNTFGVADTLREFQSELVKGGIRHSITPEQFYAATLLSATFVGVTMAIVTLTLFGPLGALFFGIPLGLITGFFLLRVVLTGHVRNRIALIEKRLPYAIEFMLLTMEANASFPMALEVYCTQMGDDDPLAEEFRQVLNDINSGLGVQTAFVNMGKRIESDQLSALVLAMTAGLETGQPIANILLVQADAARLRRYQSAEETAKTAGTRAIFPLFVAVIAILILLIGPMALKLAETPVVF